MKNKILWAITVVAIGALMLGCCATEITPVSAALLFGSLAWITPFAIANKERWL